MGLTRSFKIRNDLKEFFEYSKNLYNQALYTIKQYYKNNNKHLNYNENEINYKLLPKRDYIKIETNHTLCKGF